jgi:hypothetical protein
MRSISSRRVAPASPASVLPVWRRSWKWKPDRSAAAVAPRSGPHGEPAATNAQAGERANSQRPRAPGRRRQAAAYPAKLRLRHLRGSGRRTLPEPPPGIVDVSRNLSRAPTASLRDRLRRHLTEPVRQDGGRDRRGLRLAMYSCIGHTERRKAEDRMGRDDGRSAPIHHTVAQD